MNQYKDLFSQQASEYQKYRPTYPAELYAYLASLTSAHDQAVDCGTGNGQAALEIVRYYKHVLALDPSAAQIAKAPAHPQVQYLVAGAEEIPLQPQTVDLITVAQAFHWFNHKKFFHEVQRVLKPQGFLAIWIYDLCRITPEIDKVTYELYEGLLGPFWEPERKLLETNFADVVFPFVEIPAPSFVMTRDWTLDILIGYFSSWSALQTYRRKTGLDPLPEFRERFAQVWGNSSDTHKAVWTIRPRIFSAALK